LIDRVQVILYVASQPVARDFYRALLQAEPSLDVPGMTEFDLPGCKLGLMPAAGIQRLLPTLPEPLPGVPRCELYLHVDSPEQWHRRALALGATERSPVAPRDWGDEAGYVSDPDGHVVAFARVS